MKYRGAARAGPESCLLLCALLSFGLPGCADEDEPLGPAVVHEAVAYSLVRDPYTALQAVWEPRVPTAETLAAIATGDLAVTDVARFDDYELGVQLSAGQPWQEHLELAPDFGAGPAGSRKSLVYFWQVADPQIIDEESPIRFEGYEDLYRPHGHLSPQVFEAHVRSAQRISASSGRPFDFALVAGDLTDGSQHNELAWMLTVLNGGPVHPDSGVDDDPVEGPGNDYNDPFLSVGIEAPWYAVLGNHETLYNGGFGAITDELRHTAVGTTLFDHVLFQNGFCDGSTPLAEVVTAGTTPPDPQRLPLRLHEVLAALHQAEGTPPGHGLTDEDVATGRGYFSVSPLGDRPIRLIGLDTVNSESDSMGVGARGWFDADQLEWLAQELALSDEAGELVIVMSHHRAEDFAPSSPVSGHQLTSLLSGAEGVVLHVVGHGHRNTIRDLPEPTARAVGGYFELMLASTIDFPMQSRIFEIVDEDNGYLSIYATNLGHNSPTDALAHRGRELAAAKRVFGTPTNTTPVDELWATDLPAQNLVLRVPIPATVRARLAEHSWPSQVESDTTLSSLSGP